MKIDLIMQNCKMVLHILSLIDNKYRNTLNLPSPNDCKKI
jgi:hypothetical protein